MTWIFKAPSVHIRRFLRGIPFPKEIPFLKISPSSDFLRSSRNLLKVVTSLLDVLKSGLLTMSSRHCEINDSHPSGTSLECTYMLHSQIVTPTNFDSQKEASSCRPMDTIVLKQDYVPVVGQSPMTVSKLFPSFVIIIRGCGVPFESDTIIGISRRGSTCLERNQITSYGGDSGNLLIYSRGNSKGA